MHIGRFEAQGRGGHSEHILAFLDHHIGIGGHTWQELVACILRLGYNGIGDDILLGFGLFAHLGDMAGKGLVRIGIDNKAYGLALLDFANIGLIDHDLDLKLGQVLSDAKQDRGLKAGGDCLAWINLAVDHHTIDRRHHLGAAKIIKIGVQGGLGLVHPRGLGLDLGVCEADAGIRSANGGLGLVQGLTRCKALV